MAQTQKETQKTQSQQNYESVDATKQKEKDKFIGLPPNKRYCLTPLARHSMMLSQKTRIEAQREHPKACENHI